MVIPALISKSHGPKETIVHRLSKRVYEVFMQFTEFNVLDKSGIRSLVIQDYQYYMLPEAPFMRWYFM